jgi:class 3 adenylate cyclase/pimeloyl-ACP methyl ester carboxylesterase
MRWTGQGLAGAPETRYVRANDGSLVAFQVIGDGPLDVVVVFPAFIPIDLMWDEPRMVHFLQRLSSFARHIWFDFRGTAASSVVALYEDRLPEAWVEDIVVIADEVGCERVAVLQLGGAGIGPFFAATHPERTSALVVVDVSARWRSADDYPEGLSDDELAPIIDGGLNLENSIPSLVDDAQFRRWYERAIRLGAPPDVRRWRVRAASEVDTRAALGAVQAPTLVVCRRNAPRAAQWRYLAQHIPNAELVEWESPDRFPFSSNAGLVIDAIEAFLTGELSTAEPDRVLATVLFTDLVSSTPQVARMGDRRWRDLLATHDVLVRAELERFRGQEVNHTGDGIVATFDGPARAVRCACAIRGALGALGLEVRAGLHTGEIEVRGADVAGIAIVIGHRVSTHAGPGQVLVSRTVADLIAGSDIDLLDEGEHELKGVPGIWRLFSVSA